MNKDTRKDIMETAKALFNERGFNVVSIRDIADELRISKGNLTYYFKKKEDIIEAILDDSANRYEPPAAPATLAEMDALFLHMQSVVQENAFYFWHHTQLSQLSGKIHRQQNEVYQRNHAIFEDAFSILQDNGLIRGETFPDEHKHIIDALLLTAVYWLQFCGLKQEVSQKSDFQKQMWTTIYPLLTDKGKTSLLQVCTL